MGAHTLEQVVDSTPTEIEARNNNATKRRRRRRNKKNSDTGSTSSGSSSSPSPTRPRKQPTKIAEPELDPEEKARYVAMDCEMVGCGSTGRSSSLARVVMVDFDGNKVLDLYVRQTLEVTDYRTFVSGITAANLESEDAVDFYECRKRVLEVLKGKVLVGHALKNDMNALKIQHPWYDTRDTGKYEPFMKVRFDDGILWPRKLKDLVKNKLNRDIQVYGVAHCPFEDARSAMDLYIHARRKWEMVMTYKIKKTKEIERKKGGSQ